MNTSKSIFTAILGATLLSTMSLPSNADNRYSTSTGNQHEFVECPFKGDLKVKRGKRECDLYIQNQRASVQELRDRGFSEKSIRFQRRLDLHGDNK